MIYLATLYTEQATGLDTTVWTQSGLYSAFAAPITDVLSGDY